jgi:hypothetical protein
MPFAWCHAVDRGREPRLSDIGIVDAAGCQIEPDAANAGLAHRVEVGLAGLVVDHGNAARGCSARLHAEQCRRIVGAIDARRHDHHALEMQRLVQRAHLLGRGRLGRIDAACEEREFLRVRVDVGVTIAGAGGHLEIDLRRRLRRLGECASGVHGNSRRNRGQQDTASRQHGFLPHVLGGSLSADSACGKGRRKGAAEAGDVEFEAPLHTATTPHVIPRLTAHSNVKPASASAPADAHAPI